MKKKEPSYTVIGHSYIPRKERDDRFDGFMCAVMFIPFIVALTFWVVWEYTIGRLFKYKEV